MGLLSTWGFGQESQVPQEPAGVQVPLVSIKEMQLVFAFIKNQTGRRRQASLKVH